MILIEHCALIPKSAPLLSVVSKSKSTKVVKLKDLHFFITDTKSDGSTIYLIEAGIRIGWQQSKSHALNWCLSKVPLLKTFLIDNSREIEIIQSRILKRHNDAKHLAKLKKFVKSILLWSNISNRRIIDPFIIDRKPITKRKVKRKAKSKSIPKVEPITPAVEHFIMPTLRPNQTWGVN